MTPPTRRGGTAALDATSAHMEATISSGSSAGAPRTSVQSPDERGVQTLDSGLKVSAGVPMRTYRDYVLRQASAALGPAGGLHLRPDGDRAERRTAAVRVPRLAQGAGSA